MDNIKHSADCRRVFSRYDLACPRCQELAAGAAPRAGWQQAYFAGKAERRMVFYADLKHHSCAKSGCGPVCTAFDW